MADTLPQKERPRHVAATKMKVALIDSHPDCHWSDAGTRTCVCYLPARAQCSLIGHRLPTTLCEPSVHTVSSLQQIPWPAWRNSRWAQVTLARWLHAPMKEAIRESAEHAVGAFRDDDFRQLGSGPC